MQATFLQNHQIDFTGWDQLVQQSPQGNIFMQSWYINAMLAQWQAVVVHDDKQNLLAVMPMLIKSKYYLKYSLQPILAKYWGICLANKIFSNHYEEYSWKKKVVEAIIQAIPQKLAKFNHSFSPAFDYLLPFYWNKYQLVTRYTYILSLKNTSTKPEEGFSKSVTKKVNKALKNELIIRPEHDVNLLLKLFEENENSGKLILPKSHYQQYTNIQQACAERGQCFMLSVFNQENSGIASGLFLQDWHTTYFLSGIVSPAYRQTAAMPLLVTEAIKKAQTGTDNFDFLGSMMETIESFFRSFGPKPVAYMAAKKNALPFI